MFGVQIAFKDFIAARGIWGSQWVGFKHFKTFFASYQFGRVVSNTMVVLVGMIATFFSPISGAYGYFSQLLGCGNNFNLCLQGGTPVGLTVNKAARKLSAGEIGLL